MFRCDFCEDYKDKSMCVENPLDKCGNLCEECLSKFEELGDDSPEQDEFARTWSANYD